MSIVGDDLTEKEMGSENRTQKIPIVGPTQNWRTEGDNLGPKIGLKKYPSSATNHKLRTERNFWSENRTQKIPSAGHNPQVLD